MALNLSREETIANHRKMWNWIADETLKRKRRVLKEEYFIEHGIPEIKRPCSFCYCCDYDASHGDTCDACPIMWNNNIFVYCFYMDSEFCKWGKANNCQEAAQLAKQIANLPERSFD